MRVTFEVVLKTARHPPSWMRLLAKQGSHGFLCSASRALAVQDDPVAEAQYVWEAIPTGKACQLIGADDERDEMGRHIAMKLAERIVRVAGATAVGDVRAPGDRRETRFQKQAWPYRASGAGARDGGLVCEVRPKAASRLALRLDCATRPRAASRCPRWGGSNVPPKSAVIWLQSNLLIKRGGPRRQAA